MRQQGPEWKYVTVIEQKDKSTAKVQCCFCDKTFTGGALRIRDHLSGLPNVMIAACTKVPDEVSQIMKNAAAEKQDLKRQKRKQDVLDEATSSKIGKNKINTSGSQQSIKTLFGNKDAIDASLARGFYSAGIPFNVINNQHFRQALQDIAKFGPGYTPPSDFCLRTSLLNKAVKQVKADIQDTVMADLNQTGGTLVSDGWSNVKNKPLLNFVLVCPKGEVFVDSIDTSGEEKTGQFIADGITKQINDIGPQNVIQVVTDSAANCKSSWSIITATFPHITCGPCSAHCVDLLLEDLSKIVWIKESFGEGRNIVKFITSHHMSLALFREHSSLQLLHPNDTRFCTEFLSHKRLLEVKDSLQETVVDKRFKKWLEKKRYKNMGQEISARVLDANWWSRTDELHKLCEPIVSLLRLMDAGGSCPAIGKVYFKMFQLLQHVSQSAGLSEDDRQQITGFVNNRWKMLHTDLHSAGFVLDPEYNFEAYSQSSNDEVMSGFCNILEKFYPGCVEKQSRALMQLSQYRAATGIFSREMVKAARMKMPAHSWWSTFGGGQPELQHVAVKVLAQV